jgi:hypothetical protein
MAHGSIRKKRDRFALPHSGLSGASHKANLSRFFRIDVCHASATATKQ